MTETKGAAMIAAERTRQIEKEGWTEEHDDGNDDDQLATAAAFYALVPYLKVEMQTGEDTPNIGHVQWPWAARWWKPSPLTTNADRIKELTKAGALIAAEIDRLLRMKNEDYTT